MTSKKRIFSGIQPTGIIHLGNYFGAIYNWIQLLKKEKDLDVFCCIVDYHALTVFQKPEVLSENIKQLAKLYIACGLDPPISGARTHRAGLAFELHYSNG